MLCYVERENDLITLGLGDTVIRHIIHLQMH